MSPWRSRCWDRTLMSPSRMTSLPWSPLVWRWRWYEQTEFSEDGLGSRGDGGDRFRPREHPDPRPPRQPRESGSDAMVCGVQGCGAQPDPGYRTCARCRVWAWWAKRCQRNPALRLDYRTTRFVAGCADHGNAARAAREAELGTGLGARRVGYCLLQKPFPPLNGEEKWGSKSAGYPVSVRPAHSGVLPARPSMGLLPT